MIVMFVLACAQAPTDGPDPFATDAVTRPPPGVALTLDVHTPVEGGTLALRITHADPGEALTLAVSLSGPGAGPCPEVLGERCVGLAPPIRRFSGTADADGVLEVATDLPPSLLEGDALTVQAFAPRGPDTVASPVVHVTVGSAVCGDADAMPPDGDLNRVASTLYGVSAIASVDLDRDGHDDVVACSRGNDTPLAWMRGHGDGTFAPMEVLTLMGECYGLEVGDVDGDGVPSLMVFGGLASLNVWNGLADIDLYPEVLNEHRGQAATGDLDGDGLPDLVTSGRWGIQQCFGADGFATCSTISDTFLAGVVQLDEDGDGDLDLAVFEDGVLSIAENDGTGLLAPVAVRDVGDDVPLPVLVDIDADGDDDIVYGTDAGLFALAYDGPGSWADPVRIGDEPLVGIVLADVDGDGDADLTGFAQGSGLVWYEVDGADLTLHVVEGTDELHGGVTAGDVNGDGRADLLSTFIGLPWFEGTADGPVRRGGDVLDLVSDIQTVDLNNDGWPDALINVNADRRVLIAMNDGGVLQAPTVLVDDLGATQLAVADIDGNGWPDVLTNAGTGWGLQVIPQDADGFGAPEVVTDAEEHGRGFLVADMDRDGDPDVVMKGDQLWENVDGVLTVSGAVGDGLGNPVVADVDGDGWPDLVGAEPFVIWRDPYDYVADYDPVVRLNVGGTLAAPVRIAPRNDDLMDFATGDFDCDGDVDVVMSTFSSGLAVLEGFGDGTFGAPVGLDIPAVVGRVYTADLDADGVTDLLHASDEWLWYRGVGDLTFEPGLPIPVPAPSLLAAFGDLDLDGDVDVATASAAGGTFVGWWENPLRP